MGNVDRRSLRRILSENKYVLLVLALGLVLLLLPRSKSTAAQSAPGTGPPAGVGTPMEASGIPVDTESQRLAALLSAIRGVGPGAQVLLSRNGAVVVCAGAEDARVRLDVTMAVSAYTGLGSDRILVVYAAGEGGAENKAR